MIYLASRLNAGVIATSPGSRIPIFFLSSKSCSFPVALYMAESTPSPIATEGLAVLKIASAFTFVISALII